MAQTNRVLEPEVDTTFLITSLEYAYLSSTVVKEVAAFGGDIHKFVPDFVEKKSAQSMPPEIQKECRRIKDKEN